MSGRAEATGDQRGIQGKITARYSNESEAEVREWFQGLLGIELPAGMRNIEKALRDGQNMMKLAQEVQKRVQNPPPQAKKQKLRVNTQNAPFKQMENITTFVKFCENMGMDKAGTFQTVDLYEGRNMAQVINCFCSLGTECQRHGFDGPVIGSKPVEKNIREFTEEQMKAGAGIIGLQAGTNKCASQAGMSSGGQRHAADIKVEDMDKAGHSIVSGQMGFTGGASQAGMSTGVRHAADIRADDFDRAGQTHIGGQAGFTGGASQAGMSSGGARHAADIRADDFDRAGQAHVGGQAGFAGGASQAGMSSGKQRHAGDIQSQQMSQEGKGMIGLQMGSNKGATQAGMSTGAQRHAGDIHSGQMSSDSHGVIGLQSGTNLGASQTGMTQGGRRDVAK